MTKEELMRKAIELSVKNVAEGGGPFGAVIAKNGEIVATGVNRVTPDCDPTAHAEVSAIRAAAKKLGTFDLSGCEIYTSCEPCPMCLGAIYWAHLTVCIMEITSTMQQLSALTMPLFMRNWIETRKTSAQKFCCRKKLFWLFRTDRKQIRWNTKMIG